jgi:hypothetical protein
VFGGLLVKGRIRRFPHRAHGQVPFGRIYTHRPSLCDTMTSDPASAFSAGTHTSKSVPATCGSQPHARYSIPRAVVSRVRDNGQSLRSQRRQVTATGEICPKPHGTTEGITVRGVSGQRVLYHDHSVCAANIRRPPPRRPCAHRAAL